MDSEHRKNTRGGARLEKKARAPQSGKKSGPKPQLTQKQKILRILWIVLTVIAALIILNKND